MSTEQRRVVDEKELSELEQLSETLILLRVELTSVGLQAAQDTIALRTRIEETLAQVDRLIIEIRSRLAT